MQNGNGFALDIGTNSIGWVVVSLDANGEPARFLDAGVRIFSDGREPKSGTSLAAGRREARSMSRRRDRFKRRRRALLNALSDYGLMPQDAAARRALVAETNDKRGGAADVYALRAKALDEQLPPANIGRALFHLNQRRGFKSNRKTDKRDNDQGKIASGISRLGGAMQQAGSRTLGEFLYQRRLAGQGVRVRPSRVLGKDDKEEEGYGFYPQRSFLEAEFDAIWAAQAAFWPDLLTEARRVHLKTIIFFQRPLKRPKVGRCSFNPEEERLPKAHPLFQEFRLLKELNELELVYRDGRHEKLTLEQRDSLYTQLKVQRSAAFSALRKTIKAPLGTRFNKETVVRDKLKGDEVASELSHKERFGQAWLTMPLEQQWNIVHELTDADDPLELRSWLEARYGFPTEKLDAIAEARLPAGYGRLGPSATVALIDELRTGTEPNEAGRAVVLTERQAIERVWGDNPTVRRQVRDLQMLPPYQEVLGRQISPGTEDPNDPYDVRKGRLANPTVHIGLNQLRRVVNALIRRYGKPDQIALELARELKLNEEQKAERNREIARNTRDAEQRSKQLVELGQKDNGYNRLLLKLWRELNIKQPENRVCIYCGQPIGIHDLFSGAVDIDHILPWSRTLDDSQANRIVCHLECNRTKGNRAPFEVAEWHVRYDDILTRAENLPSNKAWRFGREAMKKFSDKEGFLARQLTDTQHLSRLAHEYLGSLFPDEEPDEWGVFARRNHIRVIPGRMTEMLRRHWGLNTVLGDHNQKNRNDHRHHAIDAAVIAVTTRSLLQRISTAAGSREAIALEETIGDIQPPWPSFRDDLNSMIGRIVVSHKADHGILPRSGDRSSTAGQLHNDTAYGFTGKEINGVSEVVHRIPFLSLDEKSLLTVRDRGLVDALLPRIHGLTDKKALALVLRDFASGGGWRGIRHVRVVETVNAIPIKDREGKTYKGYKGDANYRYDVWELPDDKWVGEIISMFDAHQAGWRSRIRLENPAARRVLSLHQNDMVAYEHPAHGLTIARVLQLSVRTVTFAGHRDGGNLRKRHEDDEDPFRYFFKSAGEMRTIKLRQVRVDELGRVYDPGPQDRETRKKQAIRQH